MCNKDQTRVLFISVLGVEMEGGECFLFALIDSSGVKMVSIFGMGPSCIDFRRTLNSGVRILTSDLP